MAGRPVKNTEYREYFAGRKLGKQIEKCNNAYELNNLWEQYISTAELERNARLINNEDIVVGCIEFIKKIDSVCDFSLDTAQFTTYKELRNKIEIKKLNLLIQGRGGKKASRTRKVNKEKRTYSDWIVIPVHGFSVNYMYTVGNNGKMVRSNAYNNWRKNFPHELIPTDMELWQEYGIYMDSDLGLEMEFIAKEEFDVDNFSKALIDVLWQNFGNDDNNVIETKCTRIGTCDSYDKGLIRFRVYNI